MVALRGIMSTLIDHVLQLTMLISLMAASISHCFVVSDDKGPVFIVIHKPNLE